MTEIQVMLSLQILIEQKHLQETIAQIKFKLKWPMDLRTNTINILVAGKKQLKSTSHIWK